MEAMKSFRVTIQGVGSILLYCHTKWEAEDQAYAMHCNIQSDRKKYKAKAN